LLLEINMAATAKVFKNGNSSALRLPAELGFKPGDQIELVSANDGSIVLRKRRVGLGHLVDALQSLPRDFMQGGRDDAPPQERDWAAFDWPPEALAPKKRTKGKK
jgi:antitoxin VapB